MLGIRQRRGRLDGVDANNGSAEALLIRSDFGREICQRRFVPQLSPQLLARSLQLPARAANSTWPSILAQSIDHGAPDATLGERLELDAARLVKTVRCVDEPDDTVLDKISDVDRVRHRGCDTSGELFYERN